ncbi:MAG: hypothetical protein AAF518_20615 [Spirochaetota bacterium]
MKPYPVYTLFWGRTDFDSLLWNRKVVLEVRSLAFRQENSGTIATFQIIHCFAGNLQVGAVFDVPVSLKKTHDDPFAHPPTVIDFPYKSPGKSVFFLFNSLPLVEEHWENDLYDVIPIEENLVYGCYLGRNGLTFNHAPIGSLWSVPVTDVYTEIEAALERNRKLQRKTSTLTDNYPSAIVAAITKRSAKIEFDSLADRIVTDLCRRLAEIRDLEAMDQVMPLPLGSNSRTHLYIGYAFPAGRLHMLAKVLDRSLPIWQRRLYIDAIGGGTGSHSNADLALYSEQNTIDDSGLYLARLAHASLQLQEDSFLCAHLLEVLYRFFAQYLDSDSKTAAAEAGGVIVEIQKILPNFSGLARFRAMLLLAVCNQPLDLPADRYILTCVYANDPFPEFLDFYIFSQEDSIGIVEAKSGEVLALSIGLYDSRPEPQPKLPQWELPESPTLDETDAYLNAIETTPSPVEISKSYLHFQCKTKDLYQIVKVNLYLTTGGYSESTLDDWRLPKNIPPGDYTVTLRLEDKTGQQIAECIPCDVRVLPAKNVKRLA